MTSVLLFLMFGTSAPALAAEPADHVVGFPRLYPRDYRTCCDMPVQVCGVRLLDDPEKAVRIDSRPRG